MSSNPLVSIIIPTYKGSYSLKRAVDSVLEQTYENIEVIVVDDNNPETNFRKTTELIMSEYSINPKVKYIKHEKNKNGAAARNTGFINSEGKYIGFLDDDDIFLSTKIEKQIKYLLIHKEFPAVYCWRYQNDTLIKSNLTGDLTKEILDLSFTPTTCSLMIERGCYEKLNGFDETFRRHQDFEFLLRFFEFYKIGVVEEPLVRICGNGIDNALHGQEYEQLKELFLTQFKLYIEKIDAINSGFKKEVYAKHYSALLCDYLGQGEFIQSIRVLVKYTYICGLKFVYYVLKKIFDSVKLKIKKKKLSIEENC